VSNSNVLARLTRGATRVAKRMRRQKHSPQLGRDLFQPRCCSGLTTMGEPEQFVVRATGATGTYWLSEPNEKGMHLLVPRERAAVFQTIKETGLAIDKMPQAFRNAGINFAVETL
jgi:hypothetical protein